MGMMPFIRRRQAAAEAARTAEAARHHAAAAEVYADVAEAAGSPMPPAAPERAPKPRRGG